MTESAGCVGTVVVVDDEEDTRELMRELIEARGYSVATAEDGVEALDVLGKADLVCFLILDLVMPRMDGFGVLNALVADPRLSGIRVCVSTSTPERAPAGLLCLPKPIDIDCLFALIDEHCAAESGGCSR